MSDDPLMIPLEGKQEFVGHSKSENLVLTLLNKTSLPAERIEAQYTTKLEHKSLLLQPTVRAGDTRTIKALKEQRRKDAKRKPRPMGAREKRKTGFNDIPASAHHHTLYIELNHLWSGYMREVLATSGLEGKLLKADYHGARIKVVQTACPSMLFICGIVIKETRQTFVVSTEKNQIKTIPKRGTIFEFELDLNASDAATSERQSKPFKWEVFGEHFAYRAAERVGKKFKGRSTVDF